MNTYKHARLTFSRRLEMAQQLVAKQCRIGQPAATRRAAAPAATSRLPPSALAR
ncbi:hypothetical protein AVE30378_03546 [Achromobacter veterisilvae]|uniref:Uncharacterized protein n=1 Tax=Achromobacter veterisilvae TaxID=2069367 RepID=A0A446CND3_9BURK|nr:hypothetical protein AVE30378_03546 [Achromobacter veterisilvae]